MNKVHHLALVNLFTFPSYDWVKYSSDSVCVKPLDEFSDALLDFFIVAQEVLDE